MRNTKKAAIFVVASFVFLPILVGLNVAFILLKQPKVYIILLNYKNWQDTLECLLSINSQSYQNLEIIVVDNDSKNDSLSLIETELENKNFRFKVHYIQLLENGGFAKGNNEGLKFAISQLDGDFFWVLNNDTILDVLALESLVNVATSDVEKGFKIGLYGSKLRYYHRPELLQAVGGKYNKWLGTLSEIGNLEIDKGQFDAYTTPEVLIGAALFVTHNFLNEVGLLGEEYFIYFEEIDWSERARKKGWDVSVVPQSIVYHKQGVAIEANGLNKNNKSLISDFYYFRNRLLITSKYFPYCLPTVYLSFVFTAFNRIRRRQWKRLYMLFDILFKYKNVKFSKWNINV